MKLHCELLNCLGRSLVCHSINLVILGTLNILGSDQEEFDVLCVISYTFLIPFSLINGAVA